jgi:hypothetical protein
VTGDAATTVTSRTHCLFVVDRFRRVERLVLVCLACPYLNRRRSYPYEQHASDYPTGINVLSYVADGGPLAKYLHYLEARAEAASVPIISTIPHLTSIHSPVAVAEG